MIPRNPAAQVKTPPPPKVRPKTWAQEELDRFLTVIEDDPLYSPLKTLSYTGMRRGEACGLRWCDLHLDADPPYLLVTQQITLGPRGTFEVGEPKAEDVRQTEGALLAPVTVAVLRRHEREVRRRRMELGLGNIRPDDFVFASWTTAGRRDCRPYRFKRLVSGLASHRSRSTACGTPGRH